MLLPNLIPLIDVTFSTPTPHYTHHRFKGAFRIVLTDKLHIEFAQLNVQRIQFSVIS
jgi:hypothetical protein